MVKGFRGRLFDFSSTADIFDLEHGFRFFDDGLLVVENGKVIAAGDYSEMKKQINQDIAVESFGKSFIFPGFVDAHVHSVQTKAISSHGNQLLDWLETYVFPNENKFDKPDFALQHTQFFFKQLLKNGTTTAAIYPAVYDASVEAVFEVAQELNMRVIAGKTWMDRNAPDFLLENSGQSYESVKGQIEKWHEKGRSHYSITPRYAITSSPESLEMAASLLKNYPGLYVQTHISENKQEIEVVNNHYNHHKGYLDVYDSNGLLTPKTLLGHGIYLTDDELGRISAAGASIVHCPTSNLFLGSGLFDYHKVLNHKISLAIGSDVGGGTSFSMLRNLHDAYKISALKNNLRENHNGHFTTLHPLEAFYLITLGGAKALSLDHQIGNFDAGKEADFVVIDPILNELLNYRIGGASKLDEILFAIMMLGDEHVVKATFLMGEKVV